MFAVCVFDFVSEKPRSYENTIDRVRATVVSGISGRSGGGRLPVLMDRLLLLFSAVGLHNGDDFQQLADRVVQVDHLVQEIGVRRSKVLQELEVEVVSGTGVAAAAVHAQLQLLPGDYGLRQVVQRFAFG